MKLVSYAGESGSRAGIMVEDVALDLQKLGSFFRASCGKYDSEDWARKHFPRRMEDLITSWGENRPCLEEAVSFYDEKKEEVRGRIPAAFSPASRVKLLAPMMRPGKFVCLGRNYREHVSESGKALPDEPVIFGQFPSAIIGPGEPIVIPPRSTKVDYEAELAFVIGSRCRFVDEENALERVAGYLNYNDVTARDVQQKDVQWTRGKNCDTFSPLGPYLVTSDEVGDPQNLRIRLEVNGEVLQDSSTSRMNFTVAQIISLLSQTMTLEPGDIIGTGSPAGIGLYQDPPRFLQPGDVVVQEIEKLGRLENPVVSWSG